MWDATTFSALPSAVRPTVERESGLWPTPQAHDQRGGKTPAQIAAMRAKGHGVSNLNESVEGWTTPTVDDANNVTRTTGQQQSLSRDSHQWATPRAEDGERGKGSQFDGLSEDVTAWATPSSRDHKDSEGMATTATNPDGSERNRLDQLPRHAFAFDTPGPTPSPTVGPMAPSDSSPPEPWLTPFGMNNEQGQQGGEFQKQVTEFAGKKKSRGLNPRFALWLMGFPTDHLDATPPKKKPSRGPRRSASPQDPLLKPSSSENERP